MAKVPKISICLPTYNHGRYLRQTLDSILGQSLRDFEVIISDDASTDDTPAIVAQVGDERLRYVRQARNLGVAENRNRCLALARGEYIAWLDSDDVYYPQMLANQSALLDAHPRVGLAHGAYELIDSDGRRLPGWPMPFTEDAIEPGKDAFRELVLTNYITLPVMVRRTCHAQVGPFATDVGKSSTDWEMWLRIALQADLAYSATPGAQYRQLSNGISATTSRSGERLRSEIRIVRRIFSRHSHVIPDVKTLECRAREARAVKALVYSNDAFTLGRRRAALGAALRCLNAVPGLLRSRHGLLWLLGLARSDEYAVYRHSRALLERLYTPLAATRFGQRMRKIAQPNPAWEETLREIAMIIREQTPAHARIVIADKYDPTLFHLSGREGWHFPDRRLLPGGYPRASGVAIQHLEELRARGASYLVFPNAAFWWLDYYQEFRRHIEDNHTSVWHDQRCMIYRLAGTRPSVSHGGRSSRKIDPKPFIHPMGFHGDKSLLDLVDKIIPHVQLFIETGTNVGSTIAYVARSYPDLRCISCEAISDFFEIAKQNTRNLSNITLHQEQSHEFLKRLEQDPGILSATPLVWLDAHGYGFEWPLREEISFLTSQFKSAYILIDDFQVPGLNCFGYDAWGSSTCSFEYIKGSLSPQRTYKLCYPNYTDHTSSFHPLRGWGLITFGPAVETLRDFPPDLLARIRFVEPEELGDGHGQE